MTVPSSRITHKCRSRDAASEAADTSGIGGSATDVSGTGTRRVYPLARKKNR